MPTHLLSRLLRTSAALLALLLSLSPALGQPARTPRQLIESLGVEIRQILEDPKAGKTPSEAEQAVADQITALIRSSEGHLLLTEVDTRDRTPLMLAVSGGYRLVVQALLADPGVRFRINVPDASGETAWMVANFAPTVTLVACEPGTLTLDRAQLLPPYLRRMAAVLQNNGADIFAIRRVLEEAGAEVDSEAAKRAWLRRCPNTAPELRQALVDGSLLPTLINEAITRQVAFNKAAREGFASIPAKPPEGMRFVHGLDDDESRRAASLLLQIGQLVCVRMPKPELRGTLNWSGDMLFKAKVATRAGVVEAVDFDVVAHQRDSRAVDYFRSTILRTLAGYQCTGDHLFEQEFQFKVN